MKKRRRILTGINILWKDLSRTEAWFSGGWKKKLDKNKVDLNRKKDKRDFSTNQGLFF